MIFSLNKIGTSANNESYFDTGKIERDRKGAQRVVRNFSMQHGIPNKFSPFNEYVNPGITPPPRFPEGCKSGAKRAIFALLLVFSLLSARPTYAACANPTGSEGDAMNNANHHVLQYCNGTQWIGAGSSALSASSEKVPTEGAGHEFNLMFFAAVFCLFFAGYLAGVGATHFDQRRQRAKKNKADKPVNLESGSVFTVLLAAVAMAGALSLVLYQTISGPMSSMVRVTNKTAAKAQLQSVASIIIMDAINNLPNSGDCDADGNVEPRSWRPGTGPAGSFPAGGGLVPTTIGAPTTDPWGTDYGYCVWDVGSGVKAAGCDTANGYDGGTGPGYNALRKSGSPTPTAGKAITQTVIAVISAGPDRHFQTSCHDYVDANTDEITTAGDDVILRYTYTEAASATASLWTLKASDSTKAIIGKNLEVGSNIGTVPTDVSTAFGSNGIINAAAVVTKGAVISGGAVRLANDTAVTSCVAANAGDMRFNATSKTIEVCDGAGNWNGSSSALSGLTIAKGPNTIDNTLYPQEWDWSTLTTQTALKLTAAALTTGTVLEVDNTNAAGTGPALKVTGKVKLVPGTGFAAPSAFATGTVSIANGGTGTTSAFTQGSVVFAGASGVYSQDNANFFWDATNHRLGIGTATPASQLEMVLSTTRKVRLNDTSLGIALGGSISFSRPDDGNISGIIGGTVSGTNDDGVIFWGGGGSEMRLVSGGGAGNGFGFYTGGAGGLLQGAAFASARPTSNLVMKITDAGLVGIGTASPNMPLEIANTYAQMALTSSSTANYSRIAYSNGSYLNPANSWIVGINGPSGTFNFTSQPTSGNWTNILNLTQGGNVGIGTTTPGDKFVVNGAIKSINGENAIVPSSIGLDYNTYGRVLIYGPDTSTLGSFRMLQVASDGLTTNIPIQVATSKDIYFAQSGGKVGIGTVNPNYPVDIQAGTNGTALNLNGSTNGFGIRFNVSNAFIGTGGSTSAAVNDLTNATDLGLSAGSGGVLALGYGAGVEGMRLGATGNVSIGTTSTSMARFVVESDNNGDSTARILNATDGTASTARLDMVAGRNPVTTGTELTMIKVAPSSTATIFGLSAADYSVLFDNSNGSTGKGLMLGTTGGQGGVGSPIIFGTNNAERMRIDNTGKVGIGTTGPLSMLSVGGAGTAGAAIYGSSSGAGFWGVEGVNNGAGSVGVYGHTSGTGTSSGVYGSTTGGSSSYGVYGVGYSVSGSNGGYFTSTSGGYALITGSGNVGIGTPSPSSLLTLLGTNSDIFVDSNLGAQATITFQHNAGSIYAAKVGAFTAASNNAGLGFAVGGNAITSPAMYIKQTGAVGIGTTDPQYTLDVRGSIVSQGAVGHISLGGAGSASSYTSFRGGVDGVNGYGWELDSFGSSYSGGDYAQANNVALVNVLNAPLVLGANNTWAEWIYADSDVQFRGNIYCGACGNWLTAWDSDRRLKKNIRPMEGGNLAKLEKLNAMTWNWRTPAERKIGKKIIFNDPDRRQMGLIAQDVEKVFPLAIRSSGNGVKQFVEGGLTGPIVEAIKELDKKCEMLAGKVAGIVKDVTEIVARLNPLEREVRNLVSLFNGDHEVIVQLKAANDLQANEIKQLKAANDNLRALVLTEGREIVEMKSQVGDLIQETERDSEGASARRKRM